MNENLMKANIHSLSDADLQALGLIVSSEMNEREIQKASAFSIESADKSKEYDAVIFVDGSCDPKTKDYAYGMQITDKTGTHYFNKAFKKGSETYDMPTGEKWDASQMNNVAGELAGAKAALTYCADHGYSNVSISYDYMGIEKWATGEWKRNNPATKKYHEFYSELTKDWNVDFTHVDGHTGIEGNEICDSLAKAALGIKDSKAKMFAKEIESAAPYVSNSERLINRMCSENEDESQTSIDKSCNIDCPF